jgi:hypothetical protein
MFSLDASAPAQRLTRNSRRKNVTLAKAEAKAGTSLLRNLEAKNQSYPDGKAIVSYVWYVKNSLGNTVRVKK